MGINGRPRTFKALDEFVNLMNEYFDNVEAENKKLKQQKDNSEDERVSPDDYVEVVSLCPTILTLTTEPKGRGFGYTWNNFCCKKKTKSWARCNTGNSSYIFHDSFYEKQPKPGNKTRFSCISIYIPWNFIHCNKVNEQQIT